MGNRPVGAEKLKKKYDNFHEDECSRIGDKGNQILYDMCKKYPNHKDEDKICAKIWLIGRAYSVAIERRPLHGMKKVKNDDFYGEVTREMKDPDIDNRIKKIPKKTSY